MQDMLTLITQYQRSERPKPITVKMTSSSSKVHKMELICFVDGVVVVQSTSTVTLNKLLQI